MRPTVDTRLRRVLVRPAERVEVHVLLQLARRLVARVDLAPFNLAEPAAGCHGQRMHAHAARERHVHRALERGLRHQFQLGGRLRLRKRRVPAHHRRLHHDQRVVRQRLAQDFHVRHDRIGEALVHEMAPDERMVLEQHDHWPQSALLEHGCEEKRRIQTASRLVLQDVIRQADLLPRLSERGRRHGVGYAEVLHGAVHCLTELVHVLLLVQIADNPRVPGCSLQLFRHVRLEARYGVALRHDEARIVDRPPAAERQVRRVDRVAN